jgi:signal transduction histidine kinase
MASITSATAGSKAAAQTAAETQSQLPAGWRQEYALALRTYFSEGGEVQLRRAYELGRVALGQGISLLDLAMLHQSALEDALPMHASGQELARQTRIAAEFLAESLSPFEMAYRGFLDANAALRGLNEGLEAEARRIARLLHDGAGQLLFAFELALADLARESTPDRQRIAEILNLANQLGQQLRCLSHELHPVVLDDLGLVPALELSASRVSKQAGLSIVVKADRVGRSPAPVETCVYRAAQEALSNVVRHARATEVTITLERTADALVCTVRDNGVGFSEPERRPGGGSGGLGLMGIRNRLKGLNGTLGVKSAPAAGTELVITVPVAGQVSASHGIADVY